MSLRLKLTAALGVALVILLVGVASLYALRESANAAASVQHSELVRAQLEHALTTLVNAETGQRGYLLTQDSDYLRPYVSARTDVAHELAAIRALTTDDTVQQRRIDSLSLIADAKLVTMNETVVLTQSGKRDSALKIIMTGRGAELTNQARRLIGDMTATEADHLAQRTSTYNNRKLAVILIVVIGSLLAAGLSIATMLWLRTDVAQLEVANDTIEQQSAELFEELKNSQMLTERLATSNDGLQRANKELDQFAYVASHDLKAPLRGIANLSQWIEEDLGDSAPADLVEKTTLIRGRVQRLEALIDGILQYSRAGRVRLHIECVNVGALLTDVVELLAPPPEIDITIAPSMPSIMTERTPLQQVFMNLLGNAIKYNKRAGAKIDVSVIDKGDRYAFSVADNGPGIAAEYHERIFGIFQTLESRDRVEGTGIGLSVVKKTVELHGGSVIVNSALGKGATFTFEWPKEAGESAGT